jgi:hypothetical protein
MNDGFIEGMVFWLGVVIVSIAMGYIVTTLLISLAF